MQLSKKGKERVSGLLTLDDGCKLGWHWLLRERTLVRLAENHPAHPFLRGTWPREKPTQNPWKWAGACLMNGEQTWLIGKAEMGRDCWWSTGRMKKKGLEGIYQVWRETCKLRATSGTSFVSLWTSEGCVGRLRVGGPTYSASFSASVDGWALRSFPEVTV